MKIDFMELEFKFDIVDGANYYLSSPEVIGLLFIPFKTGETFIWFDKIKLVYEISFEVEKIVKNRWKITVDGKTIPTKFMEQGSNNDIELPNAFTKNKPSKFIGLFKINIKETDLKIENRKPLIPIEQIDSLTNNYNEVINILESINNPISKETFLTPGKFIHNDRYYEFVGIGEPLKEIN